MPIPPHPHARGTIHTYLGYDPVNLPGPLSPPPDVVSGAFEHMLAYGSMRRLTPEELANAVHFDPSQITGLGPSLEALIAMLEERKRRILERYETEAAREQARSRFRERAARMKPPPQLRKAFEREVAGEQLRDLERLYYLADDDHSPFAQQLPALIQALGDKYQVDDLASKYAFTGREPMEVEKALEVKAELEEIDRLLAQLREAMKNAKIGVVDMEALAEYAEPGQMEGLRRLQQQIEDLIRQAAEQQGLESTPEGFRLTPDAFRAFQRKLLTQIFEDISAARSGRHHGAIVGDGAVELPRTRPYEFGDSAANMDVVQSFLNAMVREGCATGGAPGTVRLRTTDIEIHVTRNNPKCATAVILDMSGSMRYEGLFVACKKMALALDGLIRTEYPGDFLQFIEMYSLAKARHISEIPALMPKPVSIYDPVVRLRADMSDPRITEFDLPLHFTNIQRALQIARQFLAAQDTPNRQVVLITDGLPTAHFEDEQLYLLYPPHPRTEEATMREARQCAREGIVINLFLLPHWGQSHEDVQFAHRMVEATKGRVFFTGGRDLDRFVVWDYVKRRRAIVG
ncbi:MAG: hypothetical protein KDA22_12960 [Phycisphaerales bacterium]|nr:hypothetical protein [Phycisphaerales bacterium]